MYVVFDGRAAVVAEADAARLPLEVETPPPSTERDRWKWRRRRTAVNRKGGGRVRIGCFVP